MVLSEIKLNENDFLAISVSFVRAGHSSHILLPGHIPSLYIPLPIYSYRRKLVKISGGARGTRIIGGRRSWGHHGECLSLIHI